MCACAVLPRNASPVTPYSPPLCPCTASGPQLPCKSWPALARLAAADDDNHQRTQKTKAKGKDDCKVHTEDDNSKGLGKEERASRSEKTVRHASAMAPHNDVEAFHEVLRSSRRILALCGAGLSASSGLPTFRGAGGYWRNHDATKLATMRAFCTDPGLVWLFYAYRRHLALKAEPNAGHRALAALARAQDKDFLCLSQNVDSTLPSHPQIVLDSFQSPDPPALSPFVARGRRGPGEWLMRRVCPRSFPARTPPARAAAVPARVPLRHQVRQRVLQLDPAGQFRRPFLPGPGPGRC